MLNFITLMLGGNAVFLKKGFITPELERMAKMLPSFSILDYTIFTIMLVLSAVIGVYYAFFAKKKQNTTSEYLMGGKSMGVFPVSMSLISRIDK
ncbi:hypothetical protein J437_LFUL019502 [Ladona fulva]|uniref:Uncharacterized protein n=1 Tax=Ladona fulva TaxID=123851 RepID=A0A8K0KS03_LADFU|nr:hypothetical protein J437_LFUL019502 [Ladona fulva]